MPFPSLSHLFSRQKKNIFFSLIFFETSGVAYVFEQKTTDIEMVKEEEFKYTKGFDAILDDVDLLLSHFEKSIHQRFTKVLFTVPAGGLKEDGREVLSPYRGAISEIIRNLDLEALGYIELTDVITECAGSKETSLYVEIGKEKTSLVLMRNGKRIKHIIVSSHPANIVTHVSELITKDTPVHIFPIHSSVQVQSYLAELSDYQTHLYERKQLSIGLLKLLHDQLIKLEAGDESGMKELDTIEGKTSSESYDEGETIQNMGSGADSTLLIDSHHIAISDKQDKDFEEPQIETFLSKQSNGKEQEGSLEGFTVFKQSTSGQPQEEFIKPPEELSTVDAEISLGNGEISKSNKVDEGFPVMQSHDEIQPVEPTNEEYGDESLEPESTSTNTIAPFLHSLYVGLGIIITIIVASALAFEIMLHKVTLELSVPTEMFSVSQDLSNLPVSSIVEEKEVDVTVSTTGTKQIGERAKGQIMIASFDDKEASFSAGTKILQGDNVYQLDASVVLPASTIDTSSGTKMASKKTAPASATFIGSEGNIEKGKQFQVDGFPKSLYYATADTAFSGGSRSTVSVVSAKDLEKLKSMVTETAKQASDSARAGTSLDSITLDDVSLVDRGNLTYSADVGDVTQSISANGVVKAHLYTIEKNRIVLEVGAMLRKNKGETYRMAVDSLHYELSNIKLSEAQDRVDFTLHAEVPIYKNIEAQKIKEQIRLRSVSNAQSIIRKQYGNIDIRQTFIPEIPLYNLFIPYNLDNISIEIVPSK